MKLHFSEMHKKLQLWQCDVISKIKSQVLYLIYILKWYNIAMLLLLVTPSISSFMLNNESHVEVRS